MAGITGFLIESFAAFRQLVRSKVCSTSKLMRSKFRWHCLSGPTFCFAAHNFLLRIIHRV